MTERGRASDGKRARGARQTVYLDPNAFCASENFDAFIVFLPARESDAENSSQKRSSFPGADQAHTVPATPSKDLTKVNVQTAANLLRRQLDPSSERSGCSQNCPARQQLPSNTAWLGMTDQKFNIGY